MKINLYNVSVYLLLAGSFGLSACSTDDAVPGGDESTVTVRLAEARRIPASRSGGYAGTTQGIRRVRISTKLIGRVEQLTVAEGDKVSEGDIVVRLRSEDILAQQSQARANLRGAEAERVAAETQFGRMDRLFDEGSATQRELDEASTRFQSAKAQVDMILSKLDEIEERLGYAILRSPIDGLVTQKNIEAGDLAVPGAPLLVVESSARMEIVANVPETAISRFVKGDTTSIEIGVLARSLQGVITQISPASSATGRQFKVKSSIIGPVDPGVRSGMFARILLRKDSRDVLAVPEEVVVHRGQLTGLFTVNTRSLAVLRWVRTGKSIDGSVEILSGLSEGESYVVSHSGRILDGQPVRILDEVNTLQ